VWAGANWPSGNNFSEYDPQTSNSGAPLSSTKTVQASYGTLWSVTAESSASAEAGALRFYGSSEAYTYYDDPNTPASYVSATARTHATGYWNDDFMIDGGSLNGTLGHLTVGFLVDGDFTSAFNSSTSGTVLDQMFRASLQLSNYGQGATGDNVTVQGGQRHMIDWQGDRWLAQANGFDARAPGLWELSLDFTFGTPIRVYMWGDVDTYVGAFASTPPSSVTSDLLAIADFGHTIEWGGFLGLTDLSGNVVSDYSVTSLSGFNYDADLSTGATVPEPSTWWLMLSGFGLLGFRKPGSRKPESEHSFR
jgi:hypothetical protein